MTQTVLPGFAPNKIIAVLPAAYAWQVFGLAAGIAVYLAALSVLAGAGWMFLLWGWSLSRLVWVRLGILGAAFVAIGIFGAEIVSGD